MAVTRASVLGVGCFAGGREDAVRAIVDRARSGEGGYACFGNVHVLVSAAHDDRVRHALSDAWMVFPDGAPVAWLARRTALVPAARVAGPDVMPGVIEFGQEEGLRHYLFGSTGRVLAGLRERLHRNYPQAEIVGAYSPPFGEMHPELERAAIERIKAAEPHVVWCGLGAPKQELWMQRHADALSPALLLGVGAAFDFLSGTKQRAPEWMRRSGFEWLGRLAYEPRRLAGRYALTNPEFLVLAAFELAHRRRR